MTTATRGDVEYVKNHDRDFPDHQAVLHARMAAVLNAQRLLARRAPGGPDTSSGKRTTAR